MTVDVSTYPQDFQPTEPGVFQPVDPLLFLGVHPLLVLLLIALVVLLMTAAWREGRRGARARTDAAESIWRVVDRACQAAMRANSDALPGHARTLRTTLDDRLGHVLALSGGLSKPLKALDVALKGRVEVKEHGERHAAHGPDDHAAAPVPAPVPANLTVVSNSRVVIKGAKVEHEPDHGPEAPPGEKPSHKLPHKPEQKERDMTGREQADALRTAIAHFNDHWCRRAERIAELRAAARQLSQGHDDPAQGDRRDHHAH